MAEYPLPADGVKNKNFSPPNQPAPRHGPNNRKQDSHPEEQRLRNLGPDVVAYLEFAGKVPGVQRHRFTCQLFALSRQLTENVFLETVRRALHYRITDLAVVERIAWLCMAQGQPWIPDIEIDDNYRQRPTYLEGRITDAPDLSIYDKLGEGNEIEPEQATKPEQATEPEQTAEPEQTTEQSQRKSSTDDEVQYG